MAQLFARVAFFEAVRMSGDLETPLKQPPLGWKDLESLPTPQGPLLAVASKQPVEPIENGSRHIWRRSAHLRGRIGQLRGKFRTESMKP